jgi:hypothetical protein
MGVTFGVCPYGSLWILPAGWTLDFTAGATAASLVEAFNQRIVEIRRSGDPDDHRAATHSNPGLNLLPCLLCCYLDEVFCHLHLNK